MLPIGRFEEATNELPDRSKGTHDAEAQRAEARRAPLRSNDVAIATSRIARSRDGTKQSGFY
jgi:hypothetical protein